MCERPGDSQLRTIVEAVAPGVEDVLVVARDADVSLTSVLSYENVSTTSLESRAGLGIAFSPLPDDTPALSRMRDVLCERVAIYGAADWPRNDLLALGFIEVAGLEACYLFDPDVEDQPREWNNPENWANPENFGKYRW